MRAVRIIILVLLAIAFMVPAPALAVDERDLGRETLQPGDGWGSQFSKDGVVTSVTGGSAAAPEQVYTVTNRKELFAALNDGVYPPPTSTPSNAPKIIYVSGVINANVDDDNNPLTCEDYQRDGFTWEAFLAAYDPAVYGKVAPSGPLESARLTSRSAQQARVRVRIGDNTTIVGLGKDATIRGAWFDIRGSRATINKVSVQTPRTNIIIRNLTFEDVYDCFPAWSPTDGSLGAWNSELDAISLRETVGVWVDHNTFRDRVTADVFAPQVFGVHFEQHDGLLDITNASDLVTVSWNRFENHDKTMLIGSSDSTAYDTGRLRVTLHHNLFDATGQRVPRVRFGQVHVYNNYYKIINNPGYVYTWGVGIASHLYAENNAFTTDQQIGPENLIGVYKGTMLFETGTRINGNPGGRLVDVIAAFNAANDPGLVPDTSWTPTIHLTIDPTMKVIPLVESEAGPFR